MHHKTKRNLRRWAGFVTASVTVLFYSIINSNSDRFIMIVDHRLAFWFMAIWIVMDYAHNNEIGYWHIVFMILLSLLMVMPLYLAMIISIFIMAATEILRDFKKLKK